MKEQLPTYLNEQGLAGLLITGAGQHNPPMVYLTGGGHMTSGDLLLPTDGEAILYCNPMEREEAAKSGLKTVLYSEFPMSSYVADCGGDSQKAIALRYRDMLTRAGITQGKILLYGEVELSRFYSVLRYLEEIMPLVHIIGIEQGDLLQKAMMTKEPAEIDRMKNVGQISIDVVSRVAEYLTTCRVEDQTLLDEDNKPLTIGAVKKKINYWLAEQGLENPHGSIFAIGRDAGIPHSTGTNSDYLQLGKTIVYDFYPCEPGGGYFHDFTRTWCLGHAPDEVQAVFEDVRSVYDTVTSQLKANTTFKTYHELTCDLFEKLGHPTIQQNPSIVEGYVHSLGHGVGLNIHEMPFSGKNAGEDEILCPGTVFTIEPGLYYPSRGLGVRLEDTYYTDADGDFHKFAEFPLDLVLKMKG